MTVLCQAHRRSGFLHDDSSMKVLTVPAAIQGEVFTGTERPKKAQQQLEIVKVHKVTGNLYHVSRLPECSSAGAQRSAGDVAGGRSSKSISFMPA